MKRYRVLFAFLPLLLLLAACGKSQAMQPIPTVSHLKPGESATLNSWQVTLQSATVVDPVTIPQHDKIFTLKPGDRFLVLDQDIKNISFNQQTLPAMQFVLQDKDGSSNFLVQDGVPDVDWMLFGGTLQHYGQQGGKRAYILPANVHQLYWVYTQNTSNQQFIWDIEV